MVSLVVNPSQMMMNPGQSRRKLEDGHCLQWWKVFLNIYYYAGISPFCIRLESDHKNQNQNQNQNPIFILHTNTFQSIISWSFRISTLLSSFGYFKIAHTENEGRATDYFIFAYQIATFSAGLVSIYIFSRKSKDFLHVFNLIWTKEEPEEPRKPDNDGIWIWKNLGQKLSSSSFLSWCITLLWVLVVVIELSMTNWTNLPETIRLDFRVTGLFIGPFKKLGLKRNQDVVWFHYVLFLLTRLHAANISISGCLFPITICFYGQLVKEFREQVEATPKDTENFMIHFAETKSVIRGINGVFSGFLFVHLFFSVPYHIWSISSDLLLNEFGWTQGRSLFYLITYFAIVSYAAYTLKEFGDFARCWMSKPENFSSMPPNKYSALALQINSNQDMGLTVLGMYNVDPGLLAAVVSTMLTYCVIVLQLKPS